MEKKITVSEVFKISWEALKSQIWILVGLFIGISIVSFILNLLLIPLMTSVVGTIIGYVITIAISLILGLGYLKNMFQALDGEEPQFSAYGQQAPKIFTMFVAYLLASIAIMIGMIFLIVPGIYLALRLQFFAAFIVEEDAGIMESLQKSWEITKGQVMDLFILLLAMIGITIVGVLLLGVGVLVAGPLVYMMMCCAFRKLNSPLQAIEE